MTGNQRIPEVDRRLETGLRTFRDWLSDFFNDEPENRGELMDMLRDAADRELMDVEALNIIFGALQVSEMQARDIMIPRAQLVCLEAGRPLKDLLDVVIESKHSRFPVIGDDLDDVKGILHAKDLLPLLCDGGGFDLKDRIRTAKVIPESKRVNVLLQEFRATRNHMAVVVDEYGHVSGAVTIEDVLEQIVGEIEDEHDIDEDNPIGKLDGELFNVKATTAIEDFNSYFDVKFREDEFDTIGGIVLKAFGHVPERGERVDVDGMRFEVLSADSRRLRLLRVSRVP
ncbi:MAG: CBS domain-containing protein [Gammaproteobacteria bacterium]|nr:CBS domain-containing protein [Gammaproteobacteria bacterium]